MPQKAAITVAKSDSWTGETVDESVYIVKAASDIVTGDGTVRAKAGETVATIETDEAGRATSGELYLGTYTVYEAKAKDGYALGRDREDGRARIYGTGCRDIRPRGGRDRCAHDAIHQEG